MNKLDYFFLYFTLYAFVFIGVAYGLADKDQLRANQAEIDRYIEDNNIQYYAPPLKGTLIMGLVVILSILITFVVNGVVWKYLLKKHNYFALDWVSVYARY